MAGHRPFEELRAKISPERRDRAEASARAEMGRMLMATLGSLVGLRGADGHESEVEDEGNDMRISTLRCTVEALGGKLEIIAHLPGGKIAVSPFSEKK